MGAVGICTAEHSTRNAADPRKHTETAGLVIQREPPNALPSTESHFEIGCVYEVHTVMATRSEETKFTDRLSPPGPVIASVAAVFIIAFKLTARA